LIKILLYQEMIMRVGQAAERRTYRQPGDDIDLGVWCPAYRVQDHPAPVVDLFGTGVACLVADRIQRHAEPDRDARLLLHFAHRTGRQALSYFKLSLFGSVQSS
jgi:hypothetical protein